MLQRFEAFTASVATLYRCVQKIKSAEMTELGLKGGHVNCIFALSRHPEGLTAAELCALCDEDKAAISRCISDLREKSLVADEGAGDGKKYRVRLFLTDAGRAVADAVDLRVKTAVERGGAGLSEDQRTAFYDAMETIAANLQQYCEEKERNTDESD